MLDYPIRTRTDIDRSSHRLVHVVWEVTLACDLKCLHCGSRAGHRRKDELSTEQAINLVDELAKLGCRELTLIGGEAYLRRDLPKIISRARENGIYCAVQTGGRSLHNRKLDEYIDAGLSGIGVSIDGLPETHDTLRGVKGSHEAASELLLRAKEAGLNTSVNTQICSLTRHQLASCFEHFVQLGVSQWQLQLTVAMGNAVDCDELLLQPYEMIAVYEQVVDLYIKGLDHDILVIPGNNVGYFGPAERALRAVTGSHRHWAGCEAGSTVMGLEADGTIKGCPSLETHQFGLGKVGEEALGDVWDRAEVRTESAKKYSKSGFCGTCYYEPVCQAGCTWTSHSLLGYSGNNPYCYYRAKSLSDVGIREVIEKVDNAEDRPFATGRFVLSAQDNAGKKIPQNIYEDSARDVRHRNVTAKNLDLLPCGDCGCFLYSDEPKCVHCNSLNPFSVQ